MIEGNVGESLISNWGICAITQTPACLKWKKQHI